MHTVAAQAAWCSSKPAHPNTKHPQDGANTNNIITVLPRDAEDQSKRERLLSPAGALTDEEREELAAMLCPWASHDRIMHRARGASAAASAASMDSV